MSDSLFLFLFFSAPVCRGIECGIRINCSRGTEPSNFYSLWTYTFAAKNLNACLGLLVSSDWMCLCRITPWKEPLHSSSPFNLYCGGSKERDVKWERDLERDHSHYRMSQLTFLELRYRSFLCGVQSLWWRVSSLKRPLTAGRKIRWRQHLCTAK